MRSGSSQSSSTAAPAVSVELRVPHSFYSHLLITLTVCCFHIWLLCCRATHLNNKQHNKLVTLIHIIYACLLLFVCALWVADAFTVACTTIKLRAFRPTCACVHMYVCWYYCTNVVAHIYKHFADNIRCCCAFSLSLPSQRENFCEESWLVAGKLLLTTTYLTTIPFSYKFQLHSNNISEHFSLRYSLLRSIEFSPATKCVLQ